MPGYGHRSKQSRLTNQTPFLFNLPVIFLFMSFFWSSNMSVALFCLLNRCRKWGNRIIVKFLDFPVFYSSTIVLFSFSNNILFYFFVISFSYWLDFMSILELLIFSVEKSGFKQVSKRNINIYIPIYILIPGLLTL